MTTWDPDTCAARGTQLVRVRDTWHGFTYEVRAVERATPQQIVLAGGYRLRRADGAELGEPRRRWQLLTPAVQAEMAQAARDQKARRWVRVDAERALLELTPAQIEQVRALVESFSTPAAPSSAPATEAAPA